MNETLCPHCPAVIKESDTTCPSCGLAVSKLVLRRQFKPNTKRLQVLSSGGGTQSICMIVLIYLGAIPKPDIVVMADTEREASNVFEYHEKYIKPLCDEIGLEFVIIKKSDWVKNDITLASDDESVLPGFFTEFNGRDSKGELGKQPGFCSSHWKVEPIRKYLNERYGEKELTKRGVDSWIGMSFDERSRVKYPTGKWRKRYPLFEAEILREQAIQIVQDFGLPEPPRSACWMCPNRHDDEWIWMKENVPQDFIKAQRFEKELQKDFDWLYLHKSGVPVGEIIFTTKPKQQDLLVDQFCDTGMCFV
ncbi:hypothetical protein [Vibrio aestuarianus]|uniref:hypothetical protein n=1 Tax=Vibrio aestuarianus TaxID=28171 RepID=UPI00237CD166|nr:hypothetical protein [Vibrio aestuarianus]MDE1328481.1 zinc ribbon domain-containing protein [Vibrio aestuarianus]